MLFFMVWNYLKWNMVLENKIKANISINLIYSPWDLIKSIDLCCYSPALAVSAQWWQQANTNETTFFFSERERAFFQKKRNSCSWPAVCCLTTVCNNAAFKHATMMNTGTRTVPFDMTEVKANFIFLIFLDFFLCHGFFVLSFHCAITSSKERVDFKPSSFWWNGTKNWTVLYKTHFKNDVGSNALLLWNIKILIWRQI